MCTKYQKMLQCHTETLLALYKHGVEVIGEVDEFIRVSSRIDYETRANLPNCRYVPILHYTVPYHLSSKVFSTIAKNVTEFCLAFSLDRLPEYFPLLRFVPRGEISGAVLLIGTTSYCRPLLLHDISAGSPSRRKPHRPREGPMPFRRLYLCNCSHGAFGKKYSALIESQATQKKQQTEVPNSLHEHRHHRPPRRRQGAEPIFVTTHWRDGFTLAI